MRDTQTDRVLRHLREVGPLTAWEAMRDYGIMRLAARMWDLKQDGHTIEVETVHGENRFGEPVTFARYTLVEAAGPGELF